MCRTSTPVLTLGFALMLTTNLVAATPVRIVCLGDSVTKAERPGVAAGETFCAVLERSLNASDEQDEQVEVINAGIGGHTTAQGLARFESDVLAHQPDYVVIMFGLNDSWIDQGNTESRLTVREYRANLEQMLAKLRHRRIGVLLMTPNPAIAPMYPAERNVTLKPYVEAVRDLARREQLPLVDVYQRFAELAIEGVDLNTLFTDAMHPNPAGQKLIAGMLAEQFESLLAVVR
ncbi:MAG: SGNH/GDSL hydrolase family protein [Pirellulales bacterium]